MMIFGMFVMLGKETLLCSFGIFNNLLFSFCLCWFSVCLFVLSCFLWKLCQWSYVLFLVTVMLTIKDLKPCHVRTG